jgi:hypothetical protein
MNLERFTLGRPYTTPGSVKLFKSPRQSRGFPFSMKKTTKLLLSRRARGESNEPNFGLWLRDDTGRNVTSSDPISAPHVRAQHIGHHNRPVSLLVILDHRDHHPRQRET